MYIMLDWVTVIGRDTLNYMLLCIQLRVIRGEVPYGGNQEQANLVDGPGKIFSTFFIHCGQQTLPCT